MNHVSQRRPPAPPTVAKPRPTSPPLTSTGSQPVLAVRDLTKTWGSNRVLQGVSFSVNSGEIFGILGSNGAGKTTSVEILQGLLRRDGGLIDILGLDPATDQGGLRRLVGSQLQTAQLPERMRVGEAIRHFSRLAGDVVDWRSLMREWDLEHIADQAFRSLSGGQRQRLFLALALVNQPKLVFLDELTQGLDPRARRETWGLIERVRDAGTTVVLISHYMDEVQRLCDRVGVLRDGRMDIIATPSQLVADQDTSSTCTFTLTAGSDPVLNTSLNSALAQLAEVHDVTVRGASYRIQGAPTAPITVAATLAAHHCTPADFSILRPSLEDVFMNLTGITP